MPAKWHDQPFVSGSPAVKITSEERPVGPTNAQAWVITDSIRRDRNLRDKWVIRHAKRLGLEDACEELVGKYGKQAQAYLDKIPGPPEMQTTNWLPADAKSKNPSRSESSRSVRSSSARPASACRPTSSTSSAVLRAENEQLRAENEKLKTRLRKGANPIIHPPSHVATNTPWYQKHREPVKGSMGTTGDPSNMPATAREVTQQRKAASRLAKPKERPSSARQSRDKKPYTPRIGPFSAVASEKRRESDLAPSRRATPR